MTIKISNGEIVLKEFATRKMQKEIREATYDKDTNKFTVESMDKGNDIAVMRMIQSVLIDGKAVEVNQDFIDNLKSSDFDLILEEVDKILKGKELPKVQ